MKTLGIVMGSALALVLWSGCGDDGATCADGTTEIDGACVPDVECGPGTTANASGECVPDVECGEGTTDVDGECVADVACGDGTIANADGECVPDLDLVCGEGTIAVDGECLDPIEALRRSSPIEEGAEPNDPAIKGGVATPITLAAAGDSIVLHGTVSTPDANGVDWDAWFFTTTAPAQVIRVTGFSDGVPQPFVALLGDLDGNLIFDEYQRSTPINEDAEPFREIVLPVAGNYFLFVTDVVNATGGSSGSPNFSYFITVETLPPITAAGATDTTVSTLDLSGAAADHKSIIDKPVHLAPDGAAAQMATLERSAFDGAYAFQTLLLFDGSMNFQREQAFTFCREGFFGTECFLRNEFAFLVPAEGYIAVLDYESSSGVPAGGFQIGATPTPILGASGSGTLDNGGLEFYTMNVAADSLLDITATGNGDVQPAIVLQDENGTDVLTMFDDDTDGTAELRWFFDAQTDVVVVIADGEFEDPAGTDYTYDFTADTLPVTTLTSLDPGAATPVESTTGTGPALDAAGTDVGWVAIPVIPDGLGFVDVLVSDTAAEVGFTLFSQNANSFVEVDVAFPDGGGDAAMTASISEPLFLVAELVALTGSTTGSAVSGDWTQLVTYTSEGDTCVGAEALTGDSLFSVELTPYANDIEGAGVFGDCDGITGSARGGPDSFFTLTVPDGATLQVDVEGAGPGGGGDDPLVAILQDDASLCTNLGVDDTAFTCLAYDDDSGVGFFSQVSWVNGSGADMDVVIVIDNWNSPGDPADANLATIQLL